MRIIKFLSEYLKSPRTVGAVAPSSQKLARKMVSDIDFYNAKCIVEYGPGTGVFTDKLIERKNQNTSLLLLEYSEEFCRQLKEKYKGHENILIINDSAENVDIYLEKYNIKKVDYVVSGLPFASLPKSVSNNILGKTKSILKKDGLFITFQYTLLKREFIAEYFKKIDLERVVFNIPPAYVLKCQNS
ncbi:methyltransferase domain-containing protein [Clostridium swellfunianum]|uniref:class I SAM-dependent methyltransferase n=1 Tax=Clostridium swellfunianum TaxID=1367462 RepID=UPI00202F776B|nr:rRNA adenine N-6-methyltransferase family protein [Clostridium swellfunianum]MCM0648346.1 methyltransferase domain-containing protein [Clostridium swellfunianum]